MAKELKQAGLQLTVEGAKEFDQKLKDSGRALMKNAAEMKKLAAEYGKGAKDARFFAKEQEILNKQLGNQQQRTEALRSKLEKYRKGENVSAEKVNKMEIDILRSEAKEAEFARKIRESEKALEEMNRELDTTAEKTKEASKEVQQAKKDFDEVGKSVDRAGSKFESFAEKTERIGSKVSKVGDKMSRRLTMPIAAALIYATKESLDFEAAFRDVVKTVNEEAPVLKKLEKDIKELSISGLVTQSKEEITAVASTAGQLGIQTKNIIGFAKAMLQLKDSTNLGDEAPEELAKFANITGMAQEEFSNLGSSIVKLGNTLSTKEKPIVDMGMRIASAGTLAGMSVPTILGIAAAFASLGVEAEAGGTALSKMIADIDMAVAKGGKEIKKYAKVTGMSVKEFSKIWEKDSARGFTEFIKGLQRIREAGGNVSLVLDELGIKDRRRADAISRAVTAGGLMEDAILKSNVAYRENIALAEESAKKNESRLAKMKILKNKFDLNMEKLSESLMPSFDAGMKRIDDLINGFSNLTEEQRKNIVSTSLWVAAAGPVIKSLGSVIQGVGLAAKGFKILSTNGFGLAALGIGALAFAIARAKSPVEEFQERIKNMEFKVNEESLRRVREGLQTGISAAEKEYSVKIAVKAEIDDIQDDIDKVFKDGKINYRERKSLKKQLNEFVKKSIDEAQTELSQSVESYRRTLDSLKDVNGQDIFTQEEKDQLTANIENKTSSLIEQLKTYQGEYETLLDVIYKSKKPATEQQMQELDALMQKIAEVRAEIALAKDEATQAARAQYNLTVAGKGDERTAGAALGYAKGQHEVKLAEQKEKTQKLLSTIEQSDLNQEEKLKAQQAVMKDDAEELLFAKLMYSKQIAEIIKGVGAKEPELAKKMRESVQVMEQLQKLDEVWRKGKEEPEKISVEDYKKVITPEILKKYAAGTVWNGRSVNDIYAESMQDMGIDGLDNFLETLWVKMGEEVEKSAKELARENPLTAVLKAAMESGIEIDPSVADGMYADLLRIIDFAGKGEEYGIDFGKGIGTGLQDRTSIEEAKKGASKLKDSVVRGAGNLSQEGFRAGASYAAAFADGIRQSYTGIRNAAAGMRLAASVQVPSYNGGGQVGVPRKPQGISFDFSAGMQMPERARQRTGFLTGSVNNIDDSTSIYADKLIVRKESDIRAIGAEVTSQKRRERRAYGNG